MPRWREALRHLRPAGPADAAEQAKAAAVIAEGAELGPRFGFMVVMSCGIAILGLLQNSAAVIIGAMLISPLMAPIVALGFSLCLLDYREMQRSLVTLAAGILLALTTAILIVLASPLRDPTQEILARTQPNLFDLLVAVFSGLAGGYAVIKGRGETIVGVAIATALMPPLAVTGYGLATAQANVAMGSGFLFMTNLLAIALSVSLVARWYGFGPLAASNRHTWQAAIVFTTFAALSVPLGLSLMHIAKRSRLEHTTRAEVAAYLARHDARLSTLRVDVASGGRSSIDAVALTQAYLPEATQDIKRQLQKRLGQPVEVVLQQVVVADDDPRDAGRTLSEIQASLAVMRSVATKQDSAGDFQRRLTAAVGKHLGALGMDPVQRSARVFVESASGLSLAATQDLEVKLAGLDPAWTVTLVPAVSPLPWIDFAPRSAELDDLALSRLETSVWALRRWGITRVAVAGSASSDGTTGYNRRLAMARAEIVAEWLRERGFTVSTQFSFDRSSQRPLERELGLARFRHVEIRPEVSVGPVTGARPAGVQ